MKIPEKIQQLINRNALFVANHSGGKDSQVMLIELLKIVPREQLLVVHATLGELEWPGALELARAQACQRRDLAGAIRLLESHPQSRSAYRAATRSAVAAPSKSFAVSPPSLWVE